MCWKRKVRGSGLVSETGIFGNKPEFDKNFGLMIPKKGLSIFLEKKHLIYNNTNPSINKKLGHQDFRRINIKGTVNHLVGLRIDENKHRVVWYDGNDAIMVWNPKDKIPKPLKGIKKVNCLIPLDGTEEVAYSDNEKIYILNINDKAQKTKNIPFVNCLYYSEKDKALIIGDRQGKIHIWNITNDRITTIQQTVPKITVNFFATNLLLNSSDKKMYLVAVHLKKYIRIWEICSNQNTISTLKLATNIDVSKTNVGNIEALCFTYDNEYIVTGHDKGCIAIWDPWGTEKKCLQILDKLPKELSVIQLVPVYGSGNFCSFSVNNSKKSQLNCCHTWKRRS